MAGLTVHHTIEERHIFPLLGKRMAAFQDNDVHLKSHEGIHHGASRSPCVLRGSPRPMTMRAESVR